MVGSRSMRRALALLRRLLRTSSDTSADSSHLIRSEVRPDELLSSFVYQNSHVVKRINSIHYSRLMPRRRDGKANGRLETSVCRSHELSEAQIWDICSRFFDTKAPKPAIGRGEGRAEAVFKVGLKFDPDGKPYPQHNRLVRPGGCAG
jgi:hypothetical protein